MADNTEDKNGLDDLEVDEQPKPAEPQEPTEPTTPEPTGDPHKVRPANGGWGSQDVPVPAN